MKQMLKAIFTALIVVAGVCMMMYPTVASWKAQWDQSHLIEQRIEDVEHGEPSKERQLRAAREYNAALNSGALIQPDQRKSAGVGEVRDPEGQLWDYQDILSATPDGFMGRIRIKNIDIDLPIYHTASDESLLKGAGHLQGTSLPVGGKGTRAVITAHRGLASAKMFDNLDRVKPGDRIVLEIFGEVLTYEVYESRVIEPTDTDAIRAISNKDILTLITCTPLGVNTHRIIVNAERVIPTPASDMNAAGEASDLPHFPWWIFVFIALGIVIVAWLFWNWRLMRRERRREHSNSGGAIGEGNAAGDGGAMGDGGAGSGVL